MLKYCLSIVVFMVLLSLQVVAQQAGTATVYDATTRQTVPFATIKYSETGQGTIADLYGVFHIEGKVQWIEVSCLGYQPLKVTLPLKSDKVYLQHADNALTEVVIKPPYDKIRRILNTAIANKPINNPDKCDWYQCKVYYKMVADVSLPDSVINDTARDTRQMKAILESQHLLMSETYSTRTWKYPQQLQEVVTGSRFSGLKKSLFTGLVTDVLPFHAYTDYINLNGKDYHNPLSKGFEQYYKFDLVNELNDGNDTVWVLSFKPRGQSLDEFRGSIYINSNGFAISNFIGTALDTTLKRSVRVEQQYTRVVADGNMHWFPAHLNYIIDWEQKTKHAAITYHLKGNSRIDSVRFNEDNNFHFDKAHTVKLLPDADVLTDTAWKAMRPEALDKKEARTYTMIDSFGEAKHFDRFVGAMAHLPEGRISLGKIDVDLGRFFSSNYYENVRLGVGGQTNEKLIKWLSVGGWAGYGLKDVHWKYGVFTELYADKTREFVFKAGYSEDISDPGRVRLHSDLDKNYLSSYLLKRVDFVKAYSIGVKKKFGYWNFELTGRRQDIVPKYAYAFQRNGVGYTGYTAQEVSLNFRYAFAERTAPFFGSYYSLGSKYPIWYGKVTMGRLQGMGADIPYTQVLTAVALQKHINRIGNEKLLVSAGKLFADGAVPLGKLFAGAGYRYGGSGDLSFYSFGGFPAMYPYDYYTDQYVSVIIRHDFDRKLYNLHIPGTSYSSAPFVCLQYGMLYGTLQHPEAQKQVTFAVPDNAYHEAGILLNSLIKVKYLNLYYLTLNAGYFYHFAPVADVGKNGKIVMGFDFQF